MTEQESVTETERATLAELDGRPHARVFDGEPQTIRLTLEEGDTIAPHQHPDREIVLYVLEGRLSVSLDDEEHEVPAGDVVRFDGRRYVSPEALADTTALLVLAPRRE